MTSAGHAGTRRSTPEGAAAADVLAAIGVYTRDHHIPPLDRGLRSIVAGQVRNLVRGGWPVAEIRAAALALAARYDRWGGHRRITALQATMERDDEGRTERAHIERMAAERDVAHLAGDALAAALTARGLATGVLGAIGERGAAARMRRFRRPDAHGYADDGAGSCRVCGGPFGVHVTRVPQAEAS